MDKTRKGKTPGVGGKEESCFLRREGGRTKVSENSAFTEGRGEITLE